MFDRWSIIMMLILKLDENCGVMSILEVLAICISYGGDDVHKVFQSLVSCESHTLILTCYVGLTLSSTSVFVTKQQKLAVPTDFQAYI